MVSNCGGTHLVFGRRPDYEGWSRRDVMCRRCGNKFNFYMPLAKYRGWESGRYCFICEGCIPDLEERQKAIKREDDA